MRLSFMLRVFQFASFVYGQSSNESEASTGIGESISRVKSTSALVPLHHGISSPLFPFFFFMPFAGK